MREALSGLTLRGRSFLAAGLTAVVCSILLGQAVLTSIGVLVLVLPLVAVLVVSRRDDRVETHREISPRLVTAGQTASIELTLRGGGQRHTSPLLLAEDRIPYALGSPPRIVLEGLTGQWQRTARYQVRSDVRGQYPCGPLTTTTLDPFGLVEVRRRHPGTQALTVVPRTVHLPTVGLGAGWSGSGEHRPRASAAGSAEDASVREYRRGDELRRVHWRTSARRGELMVRREEHPWEARATVFLDNRATSHAGRGMASSFETAVTAAASIAAHLDHHGYTVRLATAAESGPAQGEPLTVLLERLALVQLIRRTSIEAGWSDDHTRGELVAAVLGGPGVDDSAALRRMRHGSGKALAVVLDVDRWKGLPPVAGAAAVDGVVTAAGWRSVVLGPRDRLDHAWQELGQTRAPTRGTRPVEAGR